MWGDLTRRPMPSDSQPFTLTKKYKTNKIQDKIPKTNQEKDQKILDKFFYVDYIKYDWI
tara:strand:- start:660 stop:836 length:177 start_codon:yes stop_codon:yes gene_type:complete